MTTLKNNLVAEYIMAAQYPAVLKPMAAPLSNYSATIRKVTPMGKDNGYKAGDTSRFVLPANSLVDLRTLKMHFRGSTASTNADKGFVAFPALINGMLDQITTSANGVQIESTPAGYNQLVKMLDDFTVGAEQRQVRTVEQNEVLSGWNSFTGDFWAPGVKKVGVTIDGNIDIIEAMTTVPQLAPGDRDTNRHFVIDEFPACFLGTVQPRVISTALTGDITVEFRFAPNSILVAETLGGKAPVASPHGDRRHRGRRRGTRRRCATQRLLHHGRYLP